MRRPFVFLFIFLVLGIILQSLLNLIIPIPLILGLYFALGLSLVFTQKRSTLWIGILMVFLGFTLQQASIQQPSKLQGTTGSFSIRAEVLKEPMEKNWYYEVDIMLLTLEQQEKGMLVEEKSRLQIPKEVISIAELQPGMIIKAEHGKLVELLVQRPLTGYEIYLRSKGIRHVLRIGKGDFAIERPVQAFKPRILSGRLKAHVETFLNKSLADPQGDIMKSILFGNQGYLKDDMLNAFSKSGTAHIVAVSGLHIGMIVLILEKLLSFLALGKNKRMIIISAFIIVYGFIVGFPISIIRAGLMYLLFVLAYFIDRQYDSLNALMLIGFMSLLWNPFYLMTASFQLSFSATLSILLFYPLLETYLKKLPSSIRSLLSVTIAAQLGTMPITLYYFQQFSIIALLANLLIVPLLGVVLALGLLAISISFISIPLGDLVNQLTNLLLTYIYTVVKGTAGLPFSSITIENIHLGYILCYYIFLAVSYYLFFRKKLVNKESWRKNELPEIIINHSEQST